MGIVNSLFANPEFANVRGHTQTLLESESSSKQVLSKESKPKPRPKSGPGGYGSHLTQKELEYWVKNVPIT